MEAALACASVRTGRLGRRLPWKGVVSGQSAAARRWGVFMHVNAHAQQLRRKPKKIRSGRLHPLGVVRSGVSACHEIRGVPVRKAGRTTRPPGGGELGMTSEDSLTGKKATPLVRNVCVRPSCSVAAKLVEARRRGRMLPTSTRRIPCGPSSAMPRETLLGIGRKARLAGPASGFRHMENSKLNANRQQLQPTP